MGSGSGNSCRKIVRRADTMLVVSKACLDGIQDAPALPVEDDVLRDKRIDCLCHSKKVRKDGQILI